MCVNHVAEAGPVIDWISDGAIARSKGGPREHGLAAQAPLYDSDSGEEEKDGRRLLEKSMSGKSCGRFSARSRPLGKSDGVCGYDAAILEGLVLPHIIAGPRSLEPFVPLPYGAVDAVVILGLAFHVSSQRERHPAASPTTAFLSLSSCMVDRYVVVPWIRLSFSLRC
jgi:hypothetical protein